MKKIISLLLMGMMLMGMNSCLNNDPGTNEATFTVSMYNRTITAGSGDVSEFFINNTTFKIDYASALISVNTTVTTEENNTLQFTINDMRLSKDEQMNAYRFSSPSVSAQGTTISNFSGIIDLNNGVVYVTFNAGDNKTVHGTASLPFMFTTTLIETEGQFGEYVHHYSQYDFRINKSNMTATLLVLNFITKYEERDERNRIAVFEGLKVEPTRDGYRITSPSVKSSTSGQGNVADVELKNAEFNIHTQGRRFNGKYNIGEKKVSITAYMFDEMVE